MKIQDRLLAINILDQKLTKLKAIIDSEKPDRGWIFTIRSTINMSLRQMGKRLGISAQSVKEIEQREVDGSITLRSLNDAANALDMKVVYAIIPKNKSIDAIIEKRANELAREIVLRTSNTMRLEEQEIPGPRIEKAIREKATEIKIKMPKYLWD